MAGFGKTLLNGLAGGLEGVGDYLTTQGKLQAEERLQDRQSERQMALERYRASIQADRDATQNDYRRGEIVLSGAVNRSNNIAEVGARAQADEANDKREYDQWLSKNAVEFKQWGVKQGVELSNSKKLELFKAEQTIRTQRQQEGMKPVGDDIDEATGTRVLYFKDAQNNVRPYDTGVVVQSKSETNPFTGETTRNTAKPTKTARAGWRDEQPDPAPAAAAGRKTADAATAQSWLTAGIQKAKAGEPGWAGLNDRQVANKVRDAARAAGYEVPSLK